ncbi:L-threonylcarbamoyladenylate synthase [Actinomadura algeriensis]|uniref:L-threonylcarbamoyladenylate synthase n=1 Tax=Actinomadura algeriensis TaxID=1679523 RepID=A0ABR9JKP8_9ACTN|nr:tRNA threonylcarbamoyl adenosine modification protein (Sua5/YciO/YrdC/YwlC family) [Actinomadura algeriensis]
MSRRYDCAEPMERTRGIAEAVSAVRRGELVVLPTDTVYGIGADAFTPPAVTALLEAKGRGREMPPPVLVGSVRAATALIEDLGPYGQDLIDEFWPGGLTLVCRANRSLMWDLGETKGTVAVRMPMHELAVELLKETGPLAVSSANLSGSPAARTAAEAEEMLGESVSVYLDGGTSGHGDASTIIDLTGSVPRLLRAGAVPVEKIRAVVGILLTDDEDEDERDSESDAAPLSLTKETSPNARDDDTATPSLTKDEPAKAPAPAEDAPEGDGPSLTKDEPAKAPAPAEDASEGDGPSLVKDEPAEPADAPEGAGRSTSDGSADGAKESAETPSTDTTEEKR